MNCLKLHWAGPRDIWINCSCCHVNYLGSFWLASDSKAGPLINRAGLLIKNSNKPRSSQTTNDKNSNKPSSSQTTNERVKRVMSFLSMRSRSKMQQTVQRC